MTPQVSGLSVRFRAAFFFLTILAAFYSTAVDAQSVNNYAFSQTTSGVYSPISGGTVVAAGTGLDDERYLVNLPFPFTLGPNTYTSAYLCVNGYIALGGDPGANQPYGIAATTGGYSVVAGFSTNLASLNSGTELRYQTLGSAPNRVFVAQWKDFGYSGFSNLNTNFQIRLYESTLVAEVIYGGVSLAVFGSQISVQAGLRGTHNGLFNHRSSTSSSWTSTTTATSSSANILYQSGSSPSSGLKYAWAPPICATPAGPVQGFSSVYASNTSVQLNLTAPSPAPSGYLVVRTPGSTPFTGTLANGTIYAVGDPVGNGVVAGVGTSSSPTASGLQPNTLYTLTVFPYNNTQCLNGPKYYTTNPPDTAIETRGARQYTWIATGGSASWTSPTSWTPTRTYAETEDTLIFGNGGTPTVTGIPAAYSRRIVVTGGTSATFMATGATTHYWDRSFRIDAGSTLTLDGALTLQAAVGAQNTEVAGTLNLNAASQFAAHIGTATHTGTIAIHGATAGYGGTTSVFAPGSVMHYNRSGGSVPAAVYQPGSLIKVTGAGSTPVSILLPKTGSILWDCSAQSVVCSLDVDSVFGTLTVAATGSSTLRCYNGMGTVVQNFAQTGGLFQQSISSLRVLGSTSLAGGTYDISAAGLNSQLYLRGPLVQGPTHTLTSASTSSYIPVIHFEGTALQNIVIGGSVAAVPISYTLSNAAGAQLTGSLPVLSGATSTVAAGGWSGTGSFNYAPTGATLAYVSPQLPVSASAVEWPAANSPVNLTINLTGAASANRLHLPGPRTIPGVITLTKGVLVLGPHDFTHTGLYGNFNAGTPDSSRMIAADSTGYLYRAITTAANTNWEFPIGDVTGAVGFSPVYLNVVSNPVARLIGVRVKDRQHPADASANNYLARYWTFADNGAQPMTYYMFLDHEEEDIVGALSYRPHRWTGSTWIGMPGSAYLAPGTITPYEAVLAVQPTISTTAHPLAGMEVTGRPGASTTYNWTGAVSQDWSTPTNWTPARTTPDPSDFLQFTSGSASDTVRNIPTQTIARLTVSNNTTAIFHGANSTLTVTGDADTATQEFVVDAGASLFFNGSTSAALTMAFGGTDNRATIAGRLEMRNAGAANRVNFANAVARVTPSGILAAGTSNSTSAPFPATPASLIVEGVYEHKYTSVAAGGMFPQATWATGSTVYVLGYTNGGGGPGATAQFYNLIYNCPNLTTNDNWGGFPNVAGTFTVVSTGTGTLRSSTTSAYSSTINNFLQTGGTLDLASSVGPVTQTLNILGSFTHSGGALSATSTATSLVLNFSGTSGQQAVSFLNAAPTGRITYRISNPAGIALSGSGNLSSIFALNAGGGVDVATPAASPVTTALALQYGTGSTLTYSGASAMTATAVEFPATNGPSNLTMATTGAGVTLPFSRTVGGTLTFTSGALDVGGNILTLGASAASSGILAWTAGGIKTGAGGAFERWYGTAAGQPTTPGTAIGFYPMLSPSGADRSASIYFSSTTPFASGGTIALSHNAALGITGGLSIADGAATVTSRSNAAWSFSSGNGLTPASTPTTAAVQLRAGNVIAGVTPADVRVVQAASVVGTHVAGAGAQPTLLAGRNNISFSDLVAAPLHIGSTATAAVNNVWTSVTTGAWGTPSTWDQGSVPPATGLVIISAGTTVSTSPGSVARALTVDAGGTLAVSSGALAVDTAVQNNGAISISGGALTLGPAGGGARGFISSGNLAVSGGSLAVNGYLRIAAGSQFSQSAGVIRVDGNAGGVAAASVPASTPIVEILSPALSLTGGSLMLVDPHAAPGNTLTAISLRTSFASGGPATAALPHTLVFGDGVSVDTGGAIGFKLQNGSSTTGNFMRWGHVLVQGSGAGILNRRVYPVGVASSVLAAGGNVTLSGAGAALDLASTSLSVAGDLTVTAGATLYSGTVRFENRSAQGTVLPAIGTQTVSGGGSFGSVSGIAALGTVEINNGSPGGVVFDIGDVTVSGELKFTKGTLTMAGGSILTSPTSFSSITGAGPNTGWVVGKLRRFIYNPSNSALNTVFPVGDAQRYSPVTVQAPATSVSSVGMIGVRAVPGDHPGIGASGISAAASVNRFFEIDTVGTLAFNAPMALRFDWQAADLDAGANTAAFTAARLTSSGWSSPGVKSPAYTTMLVSSLNLSTALGAWQVGAPSAAPVITGAPANATVCAGLDTSFTVTASNATSYQWEMNTGAGWTPVIPGATYAGTTGPTLYVYAPTPAMNGTQYRAVASNSAGSTESAAATLTISSGIAPSVSIAASPGTTICSSTFVTFTATPVNGGLAPTYQWKKNGLDVGNGTATYFSTTLANNDAVWVVMTSSLPCASPAAAPSNTLTMTVYPAGSPTVSIAASPAGTICAGTPVTFTATATNPSFAPQYQWKKNGANVGTNSATYTDAALLNGDVVTVVLTVPPSCALITVATSNAITTSIGSNAAPTVSIAANTGTTICAGTPVTFTATSINGGTAPTYQWKVNGVNAGSGGSTFTTTTLQTGDAVTVELTSNAPCVSTPTATSNTLSFTTTTAVTPAVSVIASPGANICAGTSVTFTATPVNGGSTPSYQWRNNGVNIGGATGISYTSSTLANGEMIDVVMTGSASCASATTDTSNGITMIVTPVIAPMASVTAAPGTTVCAGTAVTFSATTNATGGNYQWKVNGANVGTNASSYSYTPAAGDAVTVQVTTPTSGCWSAAQVTSTAVNMTVTPLTAMTLSVTGANPVCAGTTVTYTAASNVAGGTYQWSVNSAAVGTNSATHTFTPVNGDVVSAIYTAPSTACVSSATATASLTIAVTPTTLLTANVAASATSVCAGTQVTYTATTSAGSGASYQWKVNGVNTGTNSATHTYAPAAGDAVTVQVTPPVGCYSAATITSSAVSVLVNPVVTTSVTANGPASPVCAGSSATYTATTSVVGATFQWKVNGANVGSNIASHTYVPSTGDVVTVMITAPASGCFSATTATSNAVTAAVTPLLTPAISVSAPAAAQAGATVTATATVTGAGSAYSIEWKKNGAVFATTTVPTATFTKGTGTEVITATVTPTGTTCFAAPGGSNAFSIAETTASVKGAPGTRSAAIVYPNPFSGALVLDGLVAGDEVVLVDALGRVRAAWKFGAPRTLETVYPQHLAPGAYVLKIVDRDGRVRSITPLTKVD